MRTVTVILLLISTIMNTFSQSKSVDRQPVAAGRFYSSDKVVLNKDIEQLFRSCKKYSEKKDVRAIIAPHAGYVFSGRIAASALSSIPKERKFRNIFIIGSSHVMAFDGASVYNTGDFVTPLGKAYVNREIADKLKNDNKVFDFPTTAHLQEHSLEVQIPLIQNYFTNLPPIVPVIIGTTRESTLKQIAEALRPWFNDENLFIISSDFSHYPSYNDAVSADNATASGIISGDPETFLSSIDKNSSRHIDGLATSMCGWTSGLVLLYLSHNDKNLEYKKLDYCNSGDTEYGDKDRVVGYNAIALVNKGKHKKEENSFSINAEEKKILFEIARSSVSSRLNGTKNPEPDLNKIPEKLKMNYGVFVTLKINGNLRGCIGRFVSSDPLYELVAASAISSAFEDPRFPALSKEEYPKTQFEITVLGPMKRISSPDEIILGKHGIYIKKDFRAGTMLPQVAIEQGWNVEQFLGYTSRDKAGIGWDGWKNAELYVYEGVVLEEKEK
jgi:AmmeMemoRadiSam system protein B/AmmeMemoRadiSam system protein A